MADAAVVNGKAKAGGKRKTMAEKMAEESSKIVGDLKAGRQTRNAAKGIVYKPPVKKAKAPKDPNAPKSGRGRPAKKTEAAKEEAAADEKKEEDAAEDAAEPEAEPEAEAEVEKWYGGASSCSSIRVDANAFLIARPIHPSSS